jgi:hypothetical protein
VPYIFTAKLKWYGARKKLFQIILRISTEKSSTSKKPKSNFFEGELDLGISPGDQDELAESCDENGFVRID